MSDQSKNFLQANRRLLVIIGLALVCAVIYGQTVYFNFINIDDRAYIYENRAVLSGLNAKSMQWAFTAFYSGNWHPLTWLSHMLDAMFFGLNAGGHHIVNVIFHAINSILAFVVFRRMTGDLWKSAVVAFLFAVHPAHVESVAWIAERKDVLSTMFWLLTMLAYFYYAGSQRGNAETRSDSRQKSARRQARKTPTDKTGQPNENQKPKARNRKLFYALTILFFALGLMSKPMLVTLPFVLLLCDYWALERLKTLKELPALLVEKIPLFALTLVSSVITFLAQRAGGAVVDTATLPFVTRLANVALAYAKYVWMSVYPVNLVFWYPFERNIDGGQVAASIAFLAAVTFFCWQQRNRRKYLLMGWLWFLGTLVPVVGIVQVGWQSLAARYTYVPYFGLFIMLVWGLGELFEKLEVERKIAAIICAIALLIFGVLAFNQTSNWRNSETLYTHSLSITRNNYFLMSNLCLYYIHNADIETTERRCTELLGAMPPSVESENILGLIKTQTGKYDEAVRNFQNAAQMKPDWGIPFANMSAALAKQGKLDEAEKALQKAFSMNDSRFNGETLARSSNTLGAAYLEKNQTENAIRHLSKAVEILPNLAEARENLRKAKGEK